MRKLIGFFLIISWAGPLASQDSQPVLFADSIEQKTLEKHVYVLASDSLAGRLTGEPGQKKAAAYLVHQFDQMGLQPVLADSGYLQKFDVYKIFEDPIIIENGKDQWSNSDSFVSFGSIHMPAGQTFQFRFFRSADELPPPEKKTLPVIVSRNGNYMTVARQIEEAGYPFGIVVIDLEVGRYNAWVKRYNLMWRQARYSLEKPELQEQNQGVAVLSAELCEKILGVNPFKKSFRKKLDRGQLTGQLFLRSSGKQIKKITGENAIGYIPGKQHPDMHVIVTAHYDHVGASGDLIFNGADDDASGTSAILEIAESFALMSQSGNGPGMSVVFMAVSGEEIGLLGSRYYTDHPWIPLEQTVANINIDMIGRRDQTHAESDPYLYVIGADKISRDLHELNEQVNQSYSQLIFDYTYNQEDDPNRFYYRSDHYNFARRGIPVIFYFNGTHEDYHQATDTADKIEYDLLAVRTKFIFHVVHAISKRSRPFTSSNPLKP